MPPLPEDAEKADRQETHCTWLGNDRERSAAVVDQAGGDLIVHAVHEHESLRKILRGVAREKGGADRVRLKRQAEDQSLCGSKRSGSIEGTNHS